MIRKGIYLVIILFCAMTLLIGCAAEPEQISTLTSISVSPADPSIAVGASKQFIATGAYSDNTAKDLTGSVTWSTSSPAVATITAAGLASAVASGSTAISASKEGIIGNTTLTVTPDSTTQPAKAVVRISTSGALPAGTLIGGIDITVSLASGVSLKSTTNIPETDAGVVVASDVAATNSTVLATYSAPSGTVQGKARLLIGNTNGFATGEFATINADIAAGSSPLATDFAVTGFMATDLNGIEITGLTPGFTVEIQ